MQTIFPVIDIFAGPGGLGEGFSTFRRQPQDEKPVFKIALSIEKDKFAHRTLELRAFYHQFIGGQIPPNYYEYLRGNMSLDALYSQHPKEAESAKREAWLAELGKTDRGLVRSRIEEAINGAIHWVLIGGPPCQAYSLIGRSRIRGENPWKYARDHRHLLYKEYLQILADHQPPVFVMENVKGLLSSKRTKKNSQNTFELIIADLKNPLGANRKSTGEALSYKLFSFSKASGNNFDEPEPRDFVVRSEEHGIPQARHRIIILGIRSDIYKSPPDPLEKIGKVCIDEVIGDLPKLRSGLSKEEDSTVDWQEAVKSITKAKWLKSVDLPLREAITKEAKRVETNLTRGNSYLPLISAPKVYKSWYVDNVLAGVCNHETRAHIREDLHRYFFAAVFARENGHSPNLSEFPKELLPNHRNVQEAVDGSKFNDRFRVQVRGKPSTTVVSHISKDGHYYIHYDPSQCRSLTVREAARLQTFPDNYLFEGNRTQQYRQVGNAVPPMLAVKIAAIVYKVLKGSN